MTKNEISQYYYLKREAENAEALVKDFRKMAESATDSERIFFEEQEKELVLKARRCMSERERIEKYIGDIRDSLTRQVLYERYIRCKTWTAVAIAVGGGNTADGVRKISERYLAKYES